MIKLSIIIPVYNSSKILKKLINEINSNLYTKLKNGDQVEILTGKENVISPKWLELSITGKARACIKRYLHINQKVI